MATPAAGSWWRCRLGPDGRSGPSNDDPGLLGAQTRVTRLDDLVDQPQPLVEGSEGALHRVDRQPLHLAQTDPERLVERRELAGEGNAAHQPVVGVHRHAVAKATEEIDRVVADRGS